MDEGKKSLVDTIILLHSFILDEKNDEKQRQNAYVNMLKYLSSFEKDYILDAMIGRLNELYAGPLMVDEGVMKSYHFAKKVLSNTHEITTTTLLVFMTAYDILKKASRI